MPSIQSCDLRLPDGSPAPEQVDPQTELRITSQVLNDTNSRIEATVRFYLDGVMLSEVDGLIGAGFDRTFAVEFFPAEYGIEGLNLQSESELHEYVTA